MPVSQPSCVPCFRRVRFEALRKEDRRSERFGMLPCVLSVSIFIIWKIKGKKNSGSCCSLELLFSFRRWPGEAVTVSERWFFLKMRLKSVRDLEFFWLSAHWLQSWTKFPALPSAPRKGSWLLSYRELCKVDAADSSLRHQAIKVGEVHWTLCLYRNRSMFLGQSCTSMSFLRLGVWN